MISVIAVHGTNERASERGQAKRWWERGSTFETILNQDLGEIKFYPWTWGRDRKGGANSERIRESEGARFYRYLKNRHGNKEKIVIVAHSHGGNVVDNALFEAASRGDELENVFAIVNLGTPLILDHKHKFKFHPTGLATRIFLVWFFIAAIALKNAGLLATSVNQIAVFFGSIIMLLSVWGNFPARHYLFRKDLWRSHVFWAIGKLPFVKKFNPNSSFMKCYHSLFARSCYIFTPSDEVIPAVARMVRAKFKFASAPSYNSKADRRSGNVLKNPFRRFIALAMLLFFSLLITVSISVDVYFGWHSWVSTAIFSVFNNTFDGITTTAKGSCADIGACSYIDSIIQNVPVAAIVIATALTGAFIFIANLISRYFIAPMLVRSADKSLSANLRRFVLGDDAKSYSILDVLDPFDGIQTGQEIHSRNEKSDQNIRDTSDRVFLTVSNISPILTEVCDAIAETNGSELGMFKENIVGFKLNDFVRKKFQPAPDGHYDLMRILSEIRSLLIYDIEHNRFFVEDRRFQRLLVSAINLATDRNVPDRNGEAFNSAFEIDETQSKMSFSITKDSVPIIRVFRCG